MDAAAGATVVNLKLVLVDRSTLRIPVAEQVQLSRIKQGLQLQRIQLPQALSSRAPDQLAGSTTHQSVDLTALTCVAMRSASGTKRSLAEASKHPSPPHVQRQGLLTKNN